MSAETSAVYVTTGAAATARYRDGVEVFTLTRGGLMVDASIGGQKFTYKPFAALEASQAQRVEPITLNGQVKSRTNNMKAIVVSQYGGPEVMDYRDFPDPSPGPDDVCVRVVATERNPFDLKRRSGEVKGFAPRIPGHRWRRRCRHRH